MKYFTIAELVRSDTARARGIDNAPPPSVAKSLEALVDNVLDPLREAWGRPIYVSSGYRCPALNRAVGGASSSQHKKGLAADISTGTTEGNRALWDLVLRLGLPFDQMIDEKGWQWLHVSYNPAGGRRQKWHQK